jgi:hypothetical protein
LSFAKKKGHQNIIDLLVSNGAVLNKNSRATKKEPVRQTFMGKQRTYREAESRVDPSQSASVLNKRKKEKEKARSACRIVFTDKQGHSRELTNEEWAEFKKQHPVVAGYIENPDSIPRDKIEGEMAMEGWEDVASQILNNLWKLKGAAIFHKPVDPVMLRIPDYFSVIKEPWTSPPSRYSQASIEKTAAQRVRVDHRLDAGRRAVSRRFTQGVQQLQEI